jgi:two-component system chemotaxis response regulator CheY
VLNLADLRILIVDDDQFMREMIKQIIHSFGVDAIEMADAGESGLDLVASFKPDVMLCDVEMSPMSGIELLRRVRRHADVKLRETAVIMLTGHAEMRVVDQAGFAQPAQRTIGSSRGAAVAPGRRLAFPASFPG